MPIKVFIICEAQQPELRNVRTWAELVKSKFLVPFSSKHYSRIKAMPATPSLVSMRCLFFKLCCWLQHCIQWLTAIHWMQTTIEWLGIARLNRWRSPKFPSGLLSRLFSSYFNEGLFYFQVRVCDPCFDKFGLKEGSGPSTPKRSHGRPEVAADAPKLTKQVRIPVKFLIYLPSSDSKSSCLAINFVTLMCISHIDQNAPIGSY